MTRGPRTAQVLVVLGGLVLLLATGAGWVTVDASRDVGGVTVGGSSSLSGTRFASGALLAGLVALGLGVVLIMSAVSVRRIAGGLAVALGVLAAALVIDGIAGAATDGTLTAAPWAALAGAVAIAAGGVIAISNPTQRPVAGRYEVPAEQTTDDEWEIASGEQE